MALTAAKPPSQGRSGETAGGGPSMADRLREVVAGLRRDLEVSRHVMRGEVSYVLRDPVSFDTHAFPVADYRVLVALNGERTLGEAFESLAASGVCQADHEESFYRLVLELHRAGLLSLPISDEKQLQMRNERKRQGKRKALLMAPIYLKIPLWNPDAFLARTQRFMVPLFTRGAFVAWCAFALLCAYLLSGRWGDLAAQLPGLLAPEQLLSMWILLAVLKVIHEAGHGYAVRTFGGTVPETGVSLILFTPCAYVDASASWSFTSRLKRIIVCLGGMYFESWIAGLALVVWCFSEPGPLQAIAYQTMILASVTTVGFNINPLLRFDGYFILSDLLKVPNLRQAANEHAQRLLRRIFLGFDSGGRAWGPILGPTLVAWSFGAAFLRIGIVLGICAIIALKFPIVGFLAALAYGGGTLIGTLVKCLGYLWLSKETAHVRWRAVAVGCLLLVVPSTLIAWPLPRTVSATGVIEPERWIALNAPEAGRVIGASRRPGDGVGEGDPVVTLTSAAVSDELAIAEAALQAAQVEREQAELRDPAAAVRLREAERAALVRRDEARRRAEAMVVRAPFAGVVESSNIADMTGMLMEAGAPVAVLASGPRRATLVVDQHALARLTGGEGTEIELRSWAQPSVTMRGAIERIAPAGERTLVSDALSIQGGGTIATSPATGESEESLVEIRVRLDGDEAARLPRGSRIEARFPAESESYARRWYGAIVLFNEKLHAAR
jgi:putative peptide zinc metalloprotease protein